MTNKYSFDHGQKVKKASPKGKRKKQNKAKKNINKEANQSKLIPKEELKEYSEIEEEPSFKEISQDQIKPTLKEQSQDQPKKNEEYEMSQKLQDQLAENKLYKLESRSKERRPKNMSDGQGSSSKHKPEKSKEYNLNEFEIFGSADLQLEEKSGCEDSVPKMFQAQRNETLNKLQNNQSESEPIQPEFQNDQEEESSNNDYNPPKENNLDNFVDSHLEEKAEEGLNFKNHLRNLFEDRPLSIHINQDSEEKQKEGEEVIETFSDEACVIKEEQPREENKGFDILSRSNLPEHFAQKNMLSEDKKFP